MSAHAMIRPRTTGAMFASVCMAISVGIGGISLAQAQTTTLFAYDANGNQTRITDPLGRITDIGYDSLNRVSTKTQPPPASGVARPVITYTYDGVDQLASIRDPRNLTTTYTVDGIGNQSALGSPDTGNASMTFDVAGNMLSATDARGKVTSYTYDALNRITSIAFATGIANGFEYDGGGFGTANDIGHLTKFTDESGQTTLHYDGLGRLTSKVQTTQGTNGASATLTVAYTYGTEGSALGKLASVTYPSGNRINYVYDVSGHVSGLTLNPAIPGGGTSAGTTVLLNAITYSPFGPAQSWTWGDGGMGQANVYTRTFDLNGRIISYPLGNPNAGGLVRTVAYDAASRITSMTHAGGATPASFDQTFGYDDLDRVTSFTSSNSAIGYSYDASGNRTALRVGADNYLNSITSNSNRLSTTAGPVSKVNNFDAAGNATSDGTVIYAYSDRGRLQRSTKAGVPTDYLYNAIGQRVSKTGTLIGTGANFYTYDEQGHMLGEYASSGATIEETVYLGETPIAILTNGSVYQVYADHIGTPRVITGSADSAIIWRWDATDPFGGAVPNEDPSGQGSIFVYNPRFPGQLFDKESGLHYNYFRDYDPQTGRYLQSDPIGLAGGTNTYAYVRGNPLSLTDPNGLRPLTACEKSVMAGFDIPQVDLDNADLHDGEVPGYLSKDMAGITRGNDIYF